MVCMTSWLLTVMLVAVGADDISQALDLETCQGQVSSVKKTYEVRIWSWS